jgi:glutamine synthetase
VFTAIAAGKVQPSKPGSFLGLGTPVLPALPLHGGDRNRTSPFAFTGNKFEFRALGSNSSPAFPNTVLNTIVAESVDELSDKLQTALKRSGATLEKAVTSVVKEVWAANKQIVFDGDGYSEAWHKEAEKRGLANLPTTPDALPWIVNKQTIAAFKKYKVLSKRELDARYEVFTEQYVMAINIEAETEAMIARTMLLPAAVRHLTELQASGLDELVAEVEPLVKEFHYALVKLEDANLDENHPEESAHKEAIYMRDEVISAMEDVRETADRLEKLVADDLWPLPKYSEMLFIK